MFGKNWKICNPKRIDGRSGVITETIVGMLCFSMKDRISILCKAR